MSNTYWVATNTILQHPTRYYGKHITFYPEYSLVSPHKLELHTIADRLFAGYDIIQSVSQDNTRYVLVRVPHIAAYERLEARFAVEAMKLPDTESTPYENYIITGLYPDGTQDSFSQRIQ